MLVSLCILTTVLMGYMAAEHYLHARRRDSISLRVHVNGTRGKSSVSRLIGKGLRAGRQRVIVKTTGSAARLILENGEETSIYRPGPARIVEQLGVFRIAASRKADTIVVECMALQPYLQYLCEHKLVRAHVAVITNVRADHLDVMGPTVDDVALALSGVIPREGTLVMRQSGYDDFFRTACDQMRCRLRIVTDEEVAAISPAELARFSYIEHAENVAVSLAACEAGGVPRASALEAMFSVTPDLGAMRVFRGPSETGRWTFADAFAANDPDSSIMLWKMLLERYPECSRRVLIVNCRSDRLDRSRQMGEMMSQVEGVDLYILAGDGVRMAERAALHGGVAPSRILALEGSSAQEVMEAATQGAQMETLIVGMGNIKGVGLSLSALFKQANEEHD